MKSQEISWVKVNWWLISEQLPPILKSSTGIIWDRYAYNEASWYFLSDYCPAIQLTQSSTQWQPSWQLQTPLVKDGNNQPDAKKEG